MCVAIGIILLALLGLAFICFCALIEALLFLAFEEKEPSDDNEI